jgi:hypothetical protein
MSDISRSQFPNKGWQFYQPQTKWYAPTPLGSTFDQTVDLIRQHRMKNSAITAKHNLATDYNSVANELEAFTAARLGIKVDSPKFQPQQPEEDAVAGIEGFLQSSKRRLSAHLAGIKIYLATFGTTGRPVEAAESEQRATICATCPRNEPGDWKTFFSEEAAKGLLEVFGIMRNLNLSTSHDAQLGVCSACLCPLKAKVHVKLEHILSETTPEIKARLDPRCWITK